MKTAESIWKCLSDGVAVDHKLLEVPVDFVEVLSMFFWEVKSQSRQILVLGILSNFKNI